MGLVFAYGHNLDGALGIGQELSSYGTQPTLVDNNSRVAVQSVSCGSGFCVAISREGQAFSWGKWADGRLGLGPIPILVKITGRSEDVLFLKVDCGDAHCVGLTIEGGLVTWGRGGSGQQGRGNISDTFSPTIVTKLTGTRWRDVAAGENWSMALSIDGQVWSWGGCGAAVLGHGLQGSERNTLLAQTLISCFSTPDIRICRLSAGTQHAAAISDTGDLYMWGDGYPETSIGDDADTSHFVLSSLPKLVNSGQRVCVDGTNEADIGTHSVEHVVCGGRKAIAFTSGSFLSRSMSKLYHNSNESGEETATTESDLVLVVSGQRLQAHKLLLAQRSPVLRELILEEEQHRRSERNSVSGT
eukprot:jgi/Phyca11/545913/estExt2_Genewise1Plus.C_PHYCAscaffold_190321